MRNSTKRSFNYLIQLTSALLLLSACGDEFGGEEEETSSPAVNVSTPAPVAPVASANSAKVDKAPDLSATETIDAVSKAVEAGGNDSEQGLAGEGEQLSLADGEICGRNGWPANNTAPGGENGNDDWAAHKAFCALTNDSGTEETIQGSISTVRLFACLLGDELEFDDIERKIEIPMSEKCLSAEDIANFAANGITSFDFMVTLRSVPEIQPNIWDRQISMVAVPGSFITDIFGEGLALDIVYSATHGVEVAFATLLAMPAKDRVNAVAARIDIENGELRYEMLVQDYESANTECEGGGSGCGGFARHMRLKVEGEFSSEAVLTSLDQLEFAYSSLSRGDDALDPSDDRLTFASVVGQNKIGFRSQFNFSYGDPAILGNLSLENSTDFSKCHQDSGWPGCGDIGHLKFADASDLQFIMHPDMVDYVGSKQWFESEDAYLDFSAIKLDAVQ